MPNSLKPPTGTLPDLIYLCDFISYYSTCLCSSTATLASLLFCFQSKPDMLLLRAFALAVPCSWNTLLTDAYMLFNSSLPWNVTFLMIPTITTFLRIVDTLNLHYPTLTFFYSIYHLLACYVIFLCCFLSEYQLQKVSYFSGFCLQST